MEFTQQKRLRIYINEQDRAHNRTLYEALVHVAHKHNIAGAFVIKGLIGFGHNKIIYSNQLLVLSEKLPVVIEMIDTEEKLQAFLKETEGMMESGLLTLEDVEVSLL